MQLMFKIGTAMFILQLVAFIFAKTYVHGKYCKYGITDENSRKLTFWAFLEIMRDAGPKERVMLPVFSKKVPKDVRRKINVIVASFYGLAFLFLFLAWTVGKNN